MLDVDTAQAKFITTWGQLGSAWGINRTMAQIHALLLTSIQALSTDQVMDRLSISRGNANTNLRALVDWQLAQVEHRPGDRKEYFVAELDHWTIARRVAERRVRREIDPLLRNLEELRRVQARGKPHKQRAQRIEAMAAGFLELGHTARKVLRLALLVDQSKFLRPLLERIEKLRGLGA